MTIAAVRAGIKTKLDTIIGLRTYLYEPDTIQPSLTVAVIGPPAGTFAVDFEGIVTYEFPIVVAAGPRAEIERSQLAIEALCEPNGSTVNGVLVGNLSGACSSISVLGFDSYGAYDIGGQQ